MKVIAKVKSFGKNKKESLTSWKTSKKRNHLKNTNHRLCYKIIEVRIAIFLHSIGPDAINLFNTFGLDEAERIVIGVIDKIVQKKILERSGLGEMY